MWAGVNRICGACPVTDLPLETGQVPPPLLLGFQRHGYPTKAPTLESQTHAGSINRALQVQPLSAVPVGLYGMCGPICEYPDSKWIPRQIRINTCLQYRLRITCVRTRLLSACRPAGVRVAGVGVAKSVGALSVGAARIRAALPAARPSSRQSSGPGTREPVWLWASLLRLTRLEA